MSGIPVTVADYGMGNLLSVVRALEAVGGVVTVATGGAALAAAERLVLPGVGAFGDGMAELTRRGMADPLRQALADGRSLLGICLGMQLMLGVGEEFGEHAGLGLIPGRVVRIPGRAADGAPLRAPHVGWGALHPVSSWDGTPLAAVSPGGWFYFVHSYVAQPEDPAAVVALCHYGGQPLVAAVRAGSRGLGCQFHPEKSGPAGLALLAAFLRW